MTGQQQQQTTMKMKPTPIGLKQKPGKSGGKIGNIAKPAKSIKPWKPIIDPKAPGMDAKVYQGKSATKSTKMKPMTWAQVQKSINKTKGY